jgi:ABC-type long-subunit fatty acid transport system fused permease/ATPase subunit
MKQKNNYLISAVIWTLVALLALFVLLFMSSGGTAFSRACCIVLIVLCVAGQWLRWWKFR